MDELLVRLRRVAGLWPEALLTLLTLWLVVLDGFRGSGGDPSYYYHIAQQVSDGLLPYRDFPFEYPPVSLPSMLLPYFVPGGTEMSIYLGLLLWSNVALTVGTGILVLWLARRGWSVVSRRRTGALYVFLAVTLAPVVVWRFDAVPTLLTVAAVGAVAARRPAAAGVALGAAFVAKLYPLALVPALFVGQIRNRRLGSALFFLAAAGVAVAAIMGPFVALAGSAAFYPIDYATARSVQVESGAGALALLASVLGGPSARVYHDFGTWQVDSPVLTILEPLWALLTVTMVALLAIALWHRFRVDRVADAGLLPASVITQLVAALMVVVVSSRVLSPQYLFWVVPFVALQSRRKSLVFWVACLITMYVYSLNYQQLLDEQTYAVLAANVRNAILVGFIAWVLAPDLKGAVAWLVGRLDQTARAPSG